MSALTDKVKSLLKPAIDHMRYASSVEGAIKIIGGVTGYNMAPDLATQVVSLVVAAAGVISFFFSDADVKPAK